MYSSGELFQCSQEGYYCVYFLGFEAPSQINTKITLDWVQKQFVMRVHVYIISFLAWHNISINDDKNDDLYTSSLCLTRSVSILLMTSQLIVDDVTITRQLWHDHVNDDISLDIDLIHGDIHGWSCKNLWYTILILFCLVTQTSI